jgi:adenylate cyclase
MSRTAETNEGRVVSSPGDFILVEFSSASRAVFAALAFLGHIHDRNLTVASKLRLTFRVGIGIGEIIETRGDVLGTAVNQAARLQQLAKPEQVVVAGSIYEMLRDRGDLTFRPLGQLKLKNMHAIKAFEVRWASLLDHEAHPVPPPPEGVIARSPSHILPRIVVRPLRAIGHNPETSLVADSITQQLLASLGALSSSLDVYDSDSRVTSDNSYALSGTVEHADGLRVIARLTALPDTRSVWSRHYEGKTDDRVRIQTDIVLDVLSSLQIKLTEGDQARLWRRSTRSLAAWENFQKGKELERRFGRESHEEARQWYRRAIEADPSYVSAIVALAFCMVDEVRLGWSTDETASLAGATALASDAKCIDPDFPELHALWGFLHLMSARTEEAIAAGHRAIGLAPRSSDMAAYLGAIYRAVGRYEDALNWYRRARELNPTDPPWIACNMGNTYLVTGRYEEARRIYEEVLHRDPDYLSAHVGLVLTSLHASDRNQAGQHATRVLQIDPLFEVARWARRFWSVPPNVVEELSKSLRDGGLP